MKYSLQKIIDLVKRSGERFVILDQQKDAACVILPFEDFEKMLSGVEEVRHLTEDELLDKINRDIALWRSVQKTDSLPDWEPENLEEFTKGTPDDDFIDSLTEEEPVLETKEPITEEINRETEAEEDKYYFEPIE